MPKTYVYRIHPAIGVARIGCSKTSMFVGPEVRDLDWVPSGGYRDGSGHIRRQAAEFRIYEYEYANTTLASTPGAVASDAREILLGRDATDIKWTVQLGNLKSYSGAPPRARSDPFRKPNVSAATPVSGKNHPSVALTGTIFGDTVTLGDISTDNDGRLIALGGFGVSKYKGSSPTPIDNYKENPDWYDDVADGPVTARITLNGAAAPVTAVGAWLVTGVPDFAHAVECNVTLYDLAEQIASKKFRYPVRGRVHPLFTEDVYPVLQSAHMARWVAALLMGSLSGSGTHDFLSDSARFALISGTPSAPAARSAREKIFERIRKPTGPSTSLNTMPLLSDPLKLTETQYKTLQRWKAGTFTPNWPGAPPAPADFTTLDRRLQGQALDRAHMCSMVGGSFHPGIEVGEDAGKEGTWISPFRIDPAKGAGALTKNLATPWQADFAACAHEWWPSHRPDYMLSPTAATLDVSNFVEWFQYPATLSPEEIMLKMVTDWKKLGFLKNETPPAGPAYVQRLSAPGHAC